MMANNLFADEGVGPFVDEDDLRAFLEWREKNKPQHEWLNSVAGEDLLTILLYTEYRLEQKHTYFMEALKIIGNLSSKKQKPNSDDRADAKKFLSKHGKHAADIRHNKPGGSREKREKIRQAWASGKYSSRDRCAEEECGALGMSFSSARKALRGTPKPTT